MTTDNWNLLTNALMLVVIAALLVNRHFERRKADEDMAVMRGRRELDRVSFDGIRGRP